MTTTTSPLIITNTPSVEGRKIVEYCGIVFEESISDITTAKTLRELREPTFQKMQDQAKALEADAVVRVDINYNLSYDHKEGHSIALLSVSGTAVKLDPPR